MSVSVVCVGWLCVLCHVASGVLFRVVLFVVSVSVLRRRDDYALTCICCLFVVKLIGVSSDVVWFSTACNGMSGCVLLSVLPYIFTTLCFPHTSAVVWCKLCFPNQP